MKNLQKQIEEAIRTMELLKNDNPNGWIVESENHVCVGKEDGLNDTTFNVKNAVANTKAIIYDTKEDAEKYGFDYYLIDGRGIDTLGGYKHSAKEVESKLNELGIKFRNEFSDAAWVYRFIISKDSENMKILESLKCA